MLTELPPQTKDVVRTLFIKGPMRWAALPRIGRADALDREFLTMAGDWCLLADAGLAVALEMRLDVVRGLKIDEASHGASVGLSDGVEVAKND